MIQSCTELYFPDQKGMYERRRWAATPATIGTTLVLEIGQVISLRLSGRPLRVSCISGRLWATLDGDVEDYVLLPGEEKTFRGQGTVVIQALGPAAARVDCSL